ncbi:hypothetical protein TRVA0_015S02168 [Trichomonascus vanleenenianus]|uniref:uncharacterized protein n=1 Tax=Trichomonascus vanleenenianus TaxID=2268995 RepID=UPI003EC9CCB5
MPLLTTGFPPLRVLEDIELYPYDPITEPDDVTKLLQLPYSYEENPFVRLPLRQPFVPEERATIELRFEVRPPTDEYPRCFEALIKSTPEGSNLPSGSKVVVDIFDPYSYEIYPVVRSQNGFLHTIACYKKLEHLQSKIIPRFFGSFIMVPTYDKGMEVKTRQVLAVVREYIDGYFLDTVSKKQLSREQRQMIMEKVIAAEGLVDSGGVSLGFSLRPESFILVKERASFKVVVWLFAFTSLDPMSKDIYACPGNRPYALLKWKEQFFEDYGFERIVDWPWVPWLYEKYGHELDDITEEQIELVGGLDEEVKKSGIRDPKVATVRTSDNNKRIKGPTGGRIEKKKLNKPIKRAKRTKRG